jgi:hypothetical protein
MLCECRVDRLVDPGERQSAFRSGRQENGLSGRQREITLQPGQAALEKLRQALRQTHRPHYPRGLAFGRPDLGTIHHEPDSGG